MSVALPAWLRTGLETAAERRAAGQPVYTPTEPTSGGLRHKEPQVHASPLCDIQRQRPLKLVYAYRWYNPSEPAIAPRPGFVVLSLYAYKEADVVVVHKKSDIDCVENDHLAERLFHVRLFAGRHPCLKHDPFAC